MRIIDLQANNNFTNNSIYTAKYNLITFLPIFLYEQLILKYANLYFLATGIIQTFREITPTSQLGTLAPLGFVLLLTAIKEYYEDSKRHHQDRNVNASICLCLEHSQFVERQWRNIKVGDIIKVLENEYFPADLVLLNTSEMDAMCYIETSQLDGESNLKIRQARVETSHLSTVEDLNNYKAMIQSEDPNNSLYTFDASLLTGQDEFALGPSQLLLRGAQLRNTEWIYGAVVFTGKETKLMKNSIASRVKKTRLEHMMNTQIIFLLIVLLLVAIGCSAGQLLRQINGMFEKNIILLKSNRDIWANFGKGILTYIVLFSNLIPISLVITMEFVKLVIAFTIDNDVELYYEQNNTPASVKTSTLVEELGQVDFIFSDKTGTLTQNVMEFRMASIFGKVYIDANTETHTSFASCNNLSPGALLDDPVFKFVILLAVCHTVIPQKDKNGRLTYQGSSPDEIALVNAASRAGLTLKMRTPRSVIVSKDGIEFEYVILAVNEFSSGRKRMSSVVQGPDGTISLFIKGAETVIIDRLSPNDPHLAITNRHLEEFASEGYRTLCLAERIISKSEFEEWKPLFDDAAKSIENRQQKLESAAEKIENNFILLGATAIEDKLQLGVPSTISKLMEAGIRLWVLTGDRRETAVNIGYSCKLLDQTMDIFILKERNQVELMNQINLYLETVIKQNRISTDPYYKVTLFDRVFKNIPKTDNGKFSKTYGALVKPYGMVIDGRTLKLVLECPCWKLFLKLALLCKTVICCRVTPLQKALIVRLVKENVAQAITLAIGDGANDVTMIKESHLGVGISGQEGLQAARSADFAIAQFRFLKKLLLVHGAWSYSRISKVVVFSFYKNFTLYLIQFWFVFFNGFSGQTLFETWSSLSAYNILWTILAPLVIGCVDQFLSAKALLQFPKLYKQGQENAFYNNRIFLKWFLNALLHSGLIFLFWNQTLGDGDVLSNGLVSDNWAFGEMVYITTLGTVLIRSCLFIDSWTWITAISIIGSYAAFLCLLPVYILIGPLPTFGVFPPLSPELFNLNSVIWKSIVLWANFILVPIAINTIDFTRKSFTRILFPASYHIVQEIQKLSPNAINPNSALNDCALND